MGGVNQPPFFPLLSFFLQMVFKKIILASLTAVLTYPSNAFATQPFRYTTSCFLPSTNTSSTSWVKDDKCTVIEIRAEGGALLSRSIFSNLFGLTIKSRFIKGKGFVTWDSYNKFEYTWEYKTGMIPGSTAPMSYVMPGFLVENVSWD